MTVKQSRTAEKPTVFPQVGEPGSGKAGLGPDDGDRSGCFTFYMTVKQSRTAEKPPPAPGSPTPGSGKGRGSSPRTGRPARVFHVLHDGETVETGADLPGLA